MAADETVKLDTLRADIQKGINSGPGRPVQQVSAELHARYQNWAEQGAPADALRPPQSVQLQIVSDN